MLLVGRDVVAAALPGGKTAALLDGRGAAGWLLQGGTTAALLDGRGGDDGLLDGRRLHCWVGEVTTMDCYMGEGCTAGWERSASWEKTVLLVEKNVVAAALPCGKTAALLDGRGAAGW